MGNFTALIETVLGRREVRGAKCCKGWLSRVHNLCKWLWGQRRETGATKRIHRPVKDGVKLSVYVDVMILKNSLKTISVRSGLIWQIWLLVEVVAFSFCDAIKHAFFWHATSLIFLRFGDVPYRDLSNISHSTKNLPQSFQGSLERLSNVFRRSTDAAGWRKRWLRLKLFWLGIGDSREICSVVSSEVHSSESQSEVIRVLRIALSSFCCIVRKAVRATMVSSS